jgi:hypothetical protein
MKTKPPEPAIPEAIKRHSKSAHFPFMAMLRQQRSRPLQQKLNRIRTTTNVVMTSCSRKIQYSSVMPPYVQASAFGIRCFGWSTPNHVGKLPSAPGRRGSANTRGAAQTPRQESRARSAPRSLAPARSVRNLCRMRAGRCVVRPIAGNIPLGALALLETG